MSTATIDFYSYQGRWRGKSPFVKFFLAFWLMLLTLLSSSVVYHFFTLVNLSILIVIFNRTPIKVYIGLLSLPFVFLVLSVLGILLPVDSLRQGVGLEELRIGMLLMARALSSVSCLYFLVLTTPLGDILLVLRRLKIPSEFIDLMFLSYRMIWILGATARELYLGQVVRLGYKRVSIGFKSFGSLGSVLFKRSYKKADALYTAMMLRGYRGYFMQLERSYPTYKRDLIEAVVMGVVCTLVYWILR